MSEVNKKYDPSRNEILVSLWKTRNGHYKTMPVDAKGIEKLQAVKPGDTLIIRNRTPEAIASSKNPETTPTAYLERVPSEDSPKSVKGI
jgi:hypothetical protein